MFATLHSSFKSSFKSLFYRLPLNILILLLVLSMIGCTGQTLPEKKQARKSASKKTEKKDDGHSFHYSEFDLHRIGEETDEAAIAQRRKVVLEYLDGKKIKMPNSKEILFKKENVKAFGVDEGSHSINDFSVYQGTLVFEHDSKKYAARYQVRFRPIKGEPAFFGYKISEITEQ